MEIKFTMSESDVNFIQLQHLLIMITTEAATSTPFPRDWIKNETLRMKAWGKHLHNQFEYKWRQEGIERVNKKLLEWSLVPTLP